MVVYGWNERKIKQALINDKCEACNHDEHNIQVNQKYFHLFWIPLFPIGKNTYSVCTNCQKTLKDGEMDGNLYESANRVKLNTPFAAIWSFSGIFIIGLIAAGFAFSNSKEFKKETNYIMDPQINDLVVLKNKFENEENEYTVFDNGDSILTNTEYYFGLVIDTFPDSIDLVFSISSWYGSVPTKTIFETEFETEEEVWIDSIFYRYGKDELIDLHKEKVVLDIFRR